MDTSYNNTNDEFSYLGAGIYVALSLQVNLTNKLFLEFGINSIQNVLSSQKGTYEHADTNTKISYKDGGRWDLTSVAAYIHIGWRFNLEELRNTKWL